MEKNPVDGYMDNSLAAIFTMMLPGLGQMLLRKPIKGIIWSAAVGGGYLLNGWLGMFVHILCILDAAIAGTNLKLFISTDGLLKRGLLLGGLSCLMIYTCFRTGLF